MENLFLQHKKVLNNKYSNTVKCSSETQTTILTKIINVITCKNLSAEHFIAKLMQLDDVFKDKIRLLNL